MEENNTELKKSFLKDLAELETSNIVSKWLIDSIPHVFNGSLDSFINWKHRVSSLLNVDPSNITVVGSGASGISFNPNKNFKEFNERSDLDVAIISDYHFSESWRYMRNLSPHRMMKLSRVTRESIKKHVEKYIYWGTIATDRMLQHLPFGKDWYLVFEELKNESPADGREVNARIYKDYESLRAYQMMGIKIISNKLREEGVI